MRATALVATALAALAFLALSRTSQAEYPPPGSTLTVGVGSLGVLRTTVTPGASTDILCQARAPDGSPVSGVPCVFTIISEPGTDASIGSKSTTKITGGDGIARATLFAGSTPGTIQVQIEAAGSRGLVTVEVVVPSRLPSTGGERPGQGLPMFVVVAAVSGAVCLGIASVIAIKAVGGK